MARRPSLLDAIAAVGPGMIPLIAGRDRHSLADPFTAAVIERAIQEKDGRLVAASGEGTEDEAHRPGPHPPGLAQPALSA